MTELLVVEGYLDENLMDASRQIVDFRYLNTYFDGVLVECL
jgi:hypothetical protein